MGTTDCRQFEKFKLICLPSLFQNVEPLVNKRHSEEEQFLVQIGPKRCIFCILLQRIYWGDLYQFLCLCFGLMPASYVFSELLKVPIFFLHRIDTLSIIYLDDMLLKGRTAEDETLPRYSDSISARGFGINCRLCNKLRNVCNDSHTRDIVPTSGKKFKRHDYLI